ncbi:glycosyltransferase family 4 protein [Arthrobacter nitrophenolicus]|uniref:glycosyltransferase family 4 protein n=1 Tax=Arthrobacter nitrophenolicus TaxID=683150 RepID=UPI00389A2440
MKKVVILQEYVPTYREPLFRRLIQLGEANGIAISVAAGHPEGSQSRRGDVSGADFVLPLRQREIRIAGKRVVFRRIKPIIDGADLVVVEQARRNLDAYGLLLSRERFPRVALWGHGKDYVKPATAVDARLQKFLTLRSDWFFAYTRSGADAVKDLGFPADKITTLSNSVDTTSLVRDASSITENELVDFRASLGLTEKVAVFVGGLDSSKRIPFLLEAAAIAHSLDSEFRLLVVGDGDQRALVEDFSKRNRAIVYLGPLHGKDKAKALLSGSVIAMPGRVGLVAVDSFALGRPIVTTTWPWHAPEYDYLQPGLDSLAITDDVRSYGEGLSGLVSDKVRLLQLQRNCRDKASDYTIEAMADRFLAGIKRAVFEE